VDEGPVFLTSRDVAYILDCTPDDVIDLARKGQLPAVKHGKFWKFSRADVMVYKRLKEKGEKRIAKMA
jgi:excisionase family DNA binding protein